MALRALSATWPLSDPASLAVPGTLMSGRSGDAPMTSPRRRASGRAYPPAFARPTPRHDGWSSRGTNATGWSHVNSAFRWKTLRDHCIDANFVAVGFSISRTCLLYTSDAADEEDSVDLGGRRIIKKKKKKK